MVSIPSTQEIRLNCSQEISKRFPAQLVFYRSNIYNRNPLNSVIDTLRDDLPKFFSNRKMKDIYHDRIVFKISEPSHTITNCKKIYFAILRVVKWSIMKIFKHVDFKILNINQSVEKDDPIEKIVIRWVLKMESHNYLIKEYEGILITVNAGVFVYLVRDGKVIEHWIRVINPNPFSTVFPNLFLNKLGLEAAQPGV